MKIIDKSKILLTIVFFSLLSFGAIAVADIIVIVNPSSGISSIDKKQVKKIFLGKTKEFANGKTALPVEQAEGRDIRDAFNKKALKKSDSRYRAYWSKIIFSGKGSPPHSAKDDAAVKAYVAGNVDAIGYIDSGSLDGSVMGVLTVK